MSAELRGSHECMFAGEERSSREAQRAEVLLVGTLGVFEEGRIAPTGFRAERTSQTAQFVHVSGVGWTIGEHHLGLVVHSKAWEG